MCIIVKHLSQAFELMLLYWKLASNSWFSMFFQAFWCKYCVISKHLRWNGWQVSLLHGKTVNLVSGKLGCVVNVSIGELCNVTTIQGTCYCDANCDLHCCMDVFSGMSQWQIQMGFCHLGWNPFACTMPKKKKKKNYEHAWCELFRNFRSMSMKWAACYFSKRSQEGIKTAFWLDS